jgi:protein tyrosine/serine phosphatase
VSDRWIQLAGAANVRDLGGLPTRGGEPTKFGRVLRSDNLQDLTADDVELLVRKVGVRDVIDLRSGVEIESEGPGPLSRLDEVTVHHLSLFPEAGQRTDVEAADAVLPWTLPEERDAVSDRTGMYYIRYLSRRPDSVLAALRTMASSEGVALAHCAAGKDRTGVICAMALSVADVERDAIVADYLATGERLEAIIKRLRSTPTYAADLDGSSIDEHLPRPEAMHTFLGYLDRECNGPTGWLARHGWTAADSDALRARLLS